LEPRDKNGKTPLMLAKSHRHQDVVQVLQAEYKRRARCVPPLNEIWYVASKNPPCFNTLALNKCNARSIRKHKYLQIKSSKLTVIKRILV
jgi:ankyrin repeat protein